MKLTSVVIGIFVALAMLNAAPRAQAAPAVKVANPELVGALERELGSSPTQAEGAAGSLFNVAKSKLSASDWTKVAAAVPGMAGLLKAAPAAGATGTSGTANLEALAGAAGGMGGLAGAASAFSKLGLKPEMVMKAVPVLVQYVTKSGGADVGNLLASVLK
jgi:hypothetical protein